LRIAAVIYATIELAVASCLWIWWYYHRLVVEGVTAVIMLLATLAIDCVESPTTSCNKKLEREESPTIALDCSIFYGRFTTTTTHQ